MAYQRKKEEEKNVKEEERAKKEAEARKMRELEEKKQKAILAGITAKRKEEEKARREALEKSKLKQESKRNAELQSIQKGSIETDQRSSNISLLVRDDALHNFKSQIDNGQIEVPPNPFSRRFNECDIFGSLNRDDKGNVIVDEEGMQVGKDKNGKAINMRGYLIDSHGNIINNLNG